MKRSQYIIAVVSEKYSEYLEMAGEKSPACQAALLSDILASLLAKEIDDNRYYKKLLKERTNL